MYTPALTALAALLALAPTAMAARSAAESLKLEPQSRLWVAGTSTVRAWSCKAGALETSIEATPGAVGAVLGGQKAVRTLTVTVPAQQLACGNGTMDEHMWKALRAKEHQTIEFRLATYDVSKDADGVAGTMTGTLTLGGVQRTITMKARGVDAGGALHVTGTHALNMKEYGLKPPTLMMGTMKVGEVVTVHFNLFLRG
jgi:polyisoprenoid-binding protein YceI